MKSIVIKCALLSLAVSVFNVQLSYADNTSQQNYFNQWKNIATQQNQSIRQKSNYKKFNAQDYSKQDINNPTASKYYNNQDSMNNDMNVAYSKDGTAKAVVDNFNNNNVVIHSDSATMKNVIGIQNESSEISHGISTPHYKCKKESKECKSVVEKHTCEQSNVKNFSCKLTPTVEMQDIKYNEVKTVNLSRSNVLFNGSHNAIISIPYTEGHITQIHFHVRNGGNPWGCHRPYHAYVNNVSIGVFSGHCGGGLGDLDFRKSGLDIPFNSAKATLTLKEGGWSGSISGTITLNITNKKTEPKISWVNSCSNVQSTQCKLTSKTCTIKGGTKIFSGFPVTEDCWGYDEKYQCGTQKVDTCTPYENCDVSSEKCLAKIGDYCLTLQKEYSCTTQNCSVHQLVCGADTFCIDGDCTKPPTHPVDKHNFDKNISEFSGVISAADDFNKKQQQLNIFGGKSYDCGMGAAGSYDCCDGGGNILKQCSDEEKALKKARDKAIAVYVGKYCADKKLVCLAYHQGWCVFDNKISRVIEEQGRKNQLGIGFGSAKSPNCTGLTPEQIQKIDFDKIDFSELYDDIRNNTDLPDPKAVADHIKHEYDK